MKEVELLSTGVYQPGEPVPFEKIEDVIGHLDKAPERVKRIIKKSKQMVKALIGIEQCYFAVDPKTGLINETLTGMSVKAIKIALEKAGKRTEDIECIYLATPVPEYQTPPTSTMIQEELGIEKCAEIEVHSNCSGATKAMQVAFDTLRVGRFKTVVVVYSQLSSAYLVSSYFNQAKLKPENLLLRWFLSDSASALVLTGREKVTSGIKVIDVYNESVGGKLKPAMWLKLGARNLNLHNVYEEGLHHLGQDYSTVINTGEVFFVDGFRRMTDSIALDRSGIDHILASIPSTKLLNKGKQLFEEKFSLSKEKWFSNIAQKGYSGGSSVMIGLDEMIDKGIFKTGQLLTAITIESSKWMFGGFTLKKLGA